MRCLISSFISCVLLWNLSIYLISKDHFNICVALFVLGYSKSSGIFYSLYNLFEKVKNRKMRFFLILLSLVLFSSVLGSEKKGEMLSSWNQFVDQFHLMAKEANPDVKREPIELGLIGYYNLKRHDSHFNQKYLTVIDFSAHSTQKRFYLFDMEELNLVENTFVTHGIGSADGEGNASSFSNIEDSRQSSLGFYLTAETYTGRHGHSLRLDGVDGNLNDLARQRFIVVHSADYATQDHIDQYSILGRSWGCPALPPYLSTTIIEKIKEGSVFFIYSDLEEYNLRENTLYGSLDTALPIFEEEVKL